MLTTSQLITDTSIACVTSLRPTGVHNALHLSVVGARKEAGYVSFITPSTPSQIIIPYMHTPLWRIVVSRTLGTFVRPAIYAGEPAVRPAATLTRSYRVIPSQMDTAVGAKSTSGYILLCLAEWRIVTSSGQDRACLTFNSYPIGLGTPGG